MTKFCLRLLASALWALGCGSWAGPISGYPAATTPLSGTEALIGTQNSQTVQITTSQIQQYINSYYSTSPLFVQSLRAGSTIDWLSAYAYGSSGTPIVGESNTGQVGSVGACRTTDSSSTTTSCIGSMGWAFNYNTTNNLNAWGKYAECRRVTGAGQCLTAEFDATEFGASSQPQPYSLGAFTSTDLWLVAGGGCASGTACYGPGGAATEVALPAAMALGISTNPVGFRTGIAFNNAAIAGCVGSDVEVAQCNAVELAKDQVLTWFAVGNVVQFEVGSIAPSTAPGAKLLYSSTGLLYQSGSGTTLDVFDNSGDFLATGYVLSSGSGGIGYQTGSGTGGSVTQTTSRSTGVTINKTTGAITLYNTSTSAGNVLSFNVTDSCVAATDTIILSMQTGTVSVAQLYMPVVSAVAAGSFKISVYTPTAMPAEAPVINFTVIKGAAS